MKTVQTNSITVETSVNAPVEKVWQYWTNPKHITNWCHASDDWHAPYADNNLTAGGQFKTTMAAKDGSFSFDFAGVYTLLREHELIEYTMSDGRKVSIVFTSNGNTTHVAETFEPETAHPLELQREGWQAILNTFKKYTEEN